MSGLGQVKGILLVLSGKGGVGKSTVSAQLACGLQARGFKVGLLDIDLCGPSIPRMLSLEGNVVHQSDDGWIPVYTDDTKTLGVMSIGFLTKSRDEPVIWRGPKKTAMIRQFLQDVCWGELDWLVIDTPPGTSDEHITIAENLRDVPNCRAVLVSTSQMVAVNDVRREITFCRKLSIPMVGIIENMSGYVCPNCSILPCSSFRATESRNILKLAKKEEEVFGTLSRAQSEKVPDEEKPVSPADNFASTVLAELEGDEEDKAGRPPAANPETRLPLSHYIVQIKSYLKKNMLKEALDVLEVKMLQRDGRKPDEYVYTLLIHACGKRGYTKKAFELFNQMKSRGLKPGPSLYTALFNACANSPWKEDGLERAHRLYDLMQERGYTLNVTQYECAIKAFGRCGELDTALKLVDAMLKEGHYLTISAVNALLHGCIDDKTSGFRYALLVWRKMRGKQVSPNLQTYNLLLRAVRDCNAGDSDNCGQELLEFLMSREAPSRRQYDKLVHGQRQALAQPRAMFRLNPGESDPVSSEDQLQQHSEALMQALSLETCPVPLDLLGKNLFSLQSMHDVIGITRLDKPEDRLMLLGGMPRILLQIRADGLTPDIKTFSQLLSSLPRKDSSEMLLLELLKIHNVQPDTDFFNQLIKRQCLRGFWSGARNSLRIMSAEEGCYPDIVTFGVLALGCSSLEKQEELMEDMKDMGFSLNVEILGAFLREAGRYKDYSRAIGLMTIMDDEKLTPNPHVLTMFETLRKHALNDRLLGESHVYNAGNKCADLSKEDERRKNGAIQFLRSYKKFLKTHAIEEDQHPWKQFEIGNPPRTEVV
ncbi:unnamed protein product [Notodromas monacha]|uniref:Cytosolic Fe-S cluster assembly factor NUBP2 n=1 Tax=Notodromas monacha TaxID=399045 RepID=A0A7R9BFD7_9CRUS|nr:unnamed protein product [Notodromas monacha]CAG0913783.1 unnamed protein product [Notodromas monacha]